MSEVRGLGREAIMYAMATLINGAASFAGMYIFSRLLVPSEYGYYYLVLAVVDITSGLSTTWINLTLVRYYPSIAQDERAVFFGRLLAANLMAAAVLLVAALLSMPISMLIVHQPWLPLLVLIVILPQSWLGFAQNLFRAQRRPHQWLLTVAAMSLGRLALGWWVLSTIHASGLMLVLVQSTAVLIAAVYAALRLKQPIVFNRASFRWHDLKPLVRYGLPLSLVSSGSWLMVSSGRLILGALVGTAAVGIFASAYALASNLMQLAMSPISLASEAVSFRVYEREGPEAARRYLSHYVGMLVFISCGMALTLFLLRTQIVDALLDPKYAASAAVVVFIAPAVALMQLHPTLARSFEYVKRTGALSKYTLSSGIVNVVLNFALVPFFREIGTAISSLVTYAIYVSVTYFGGQKRFAWPLPWAPITALVVPVLSVVFLNMIVFSFSDGPSGLLETLLCALGYILCFVLMAAVALRFGGPQLRAQLDFIHQVFARKTSTF